ncbi:MAG: PqqD family protein [Oscillospiraceae bacterium]|nr:PqqD family protein [Oscillospiraceae bacterium]
MKRNSGFLIRQVAGRYVLAPVGETVKTFSGMITMNATGKFLWDLLEQDQTVDSLAQALVNEYEVEFEKAKEDVIKYIEPLLPVKAILE